MYNIIWKDLDIVLFLLLGLKDIIIQDERVLIFLCQDQPPWLASPSRSIEKSKSILVVDNLYNDRSRHIPLQKVSNLKSLTELLIPHNWIGSPHSTTSQFSTSLVTTSLVSSTEPIKEAVFPKVVICNKYRLR